jgi:hypothetical protein
METFDANHFQAQEAYKITTQSKKNIFFSFYLIYCVTVTKGSVYIYVQTITNTSPLSRSTKIWEYNLDEW